MDPALVVAGEPATSTPQVKTTSKSPGRIALDRLRHDKVAVICATVVVIFLLIAIFAPLLAKLEGQTPDAIHSNLVDDFGYPTSGPSSQHWFGVEPRLGRDLFARWVYGARPSLIVAVSASVITTVLGVVFGLLSGFVGGAIDRVVTWVVDFFLCLPYLLFVIAMVPIVSLWFGPDASRSDSENSLIRLWTIVAIFAVFGWQGLARLIRGEVLSLREREFVSAARALGVPTRQILFKELLPNLTGPIIVSLTLAIPAYVAGEAGLSFLGVGLIEPTASWGRTIDDATNYYASDPLYLWLPALAILGLVLSLSLLGDAIRDAFDPKTRR
jgi:peptide/nickel transport system permease protein